MSLRTSAIEIQTGFLYSFLKFTVSSSEQQGDSSSVPASLLEEQIKQRSSIVFNIDEDDYLVRHLKKKGGSLFCGERRGAKTYLMVDIFCRTMSKNCTKVRAARAARLFFLIQPIRSSLLGVVVADGVVLA